MFYFYLFISMAGLISFSLAGVFLLFIAALETLLPFTAANKTLTLNLISIRSLSSVSLSSLFLLHSLISLSLTSIAVSSLFILYSLSFLLPFLSPLLPILSLSSFLQELLFLSLRLEDPDAAGVEVQYFNLLRVPILVVLVSTIISFSRPRSPFPCLARAAGLALHGTWMIQMAFSFFTSAIAHGCFLQRKSWGDFTVKCKGHREYHRGRAIATLQFNCHLALIVVAAVGIYAMVVENKKMNRGGSGYRQLNKEMEGLGNGDNGSLSRFTLDSDEDEGGVKNGDVALPVSEMQNGFGGDH